MKRLFWKMAATAALIAFAAAAGAQEKIRIAGNFATEHTSSLAMEKVFKSELARLSNNQLGVDIFPAMQLGGAKENVDAVRSGALFMTWVGVAFLSRIVPELEAISLPFLMPNREVALKIVDGDVGNLIDRKYAEKGFISLGWMELGSRHVTNSKHPIKSMADLKGLKIRMQPLETHLATFRALGANPIAMDVKELYSAMQQGVVDGQENPYPIISANRYSEVQKYLSNTAHFFDFIAIVANRKQFEADEARTAEGGPGRDGRSGSVSAKNCRRGRPQGAGRTEKENAVRRSISTSARGDAQSVGRRRRSGQKAHRRRAGGPRSGRSGQGTLSRRERNQEGEGRCLVNLQRRAR